MLPDKGLYLDSNEFKQPKGTWRDAKNILRGRKKGAFTSDLGTAATATGYPFATAKPIGTTVFPDGSYVIYSDGINGGTDRLGVVETNGVYSDIIVDNLLNFNQNYPIRSSEIDYNFLNQRIVSWTDKFNVPRILNIDNPGFELTLAKAFLYPEDIVKLNLFPSFKSPNIKATVLNSGGSIKAGAYSFAIGYENNDGTKTNYSIVQESIYITEDTTSVASEYDGTLPGSITSKSVNLTITDVDLSYDTLVLLGISTINGIKSAFEIKRIQINKLGGSTINTTYIGSESIVSISLEQLLTPKPIYTKAGCMAQLNNTLYIADLETQEDIDFQEVANQVRIYYNSTLRSVNQVDTCELPTFAHGEVYAFYIHFVLSNGSLSKGFHIPGRTEIPGEPDPRANVTIDGITAKRYQLVDTTGNNNGSYSLNSALPLKNGSIGATIYTNPMPFYSNMGFWENENEVYPENFPVLAGENVRHHVFPTYEACRLRHYYNNAEYLKSALDILGIDVHVPYFPVAVQNSVKGYVISYAKKGYQDCINYGLDLMQFSGNKFVDDGTELDLPMNSGFEIPGSNGNFVSFDSVRSHNIDLLKDKPQLSTNGLYMRCEARYRYFGPVKSNASLSSDYVSRDRESFVYLMDYINRPVKTLMSQTFGVKVAFPSGVVGNNKAYNVSNFKYLPNGIIDGNIYNLRSGEFLYLSKGSPYSFPGFSAKKVFFLPIKNADDYADIPHNLANFTGIPMGNENEPTNFVEETFLYSLRQVKTNVHSLYNQQQLILCSDINPVGTLDSYVQFLIGYGDRFIGPRTMMNLGTTAPENLTEVKNRGLVIKYHICESRYNTRLRYIVDGNENTKYYPKVAASDFYKVKDDRKIQFDYAANTYDSSGFNSDYKQLNNYNQSIIYDPLTVNTTTNKFPFRVIRSGVAGTNITGINSWKTFLSNDFYDKNRNRGPIENLAALDDVLIIHHKYGLFRTIGANRLTFDTTEVFLGTGDIFSQEPKSPIPAKLGYLGTQNIFSCCSFAGGYAWCDQTMGRVFLLSSSGVKEISSQGMFNYFRDNLKIDDSLPNNPFISQGLITVFDPYFNRLIFVKKANTNGFTISYSLEEDIWVSWHDYTPDWLFSTSTNFLGIKNNKVYKFNQEDVISKYFEDSIQSSYIDLVFNDYQQDDKIFFNLNWLSEMFDAAGNHIRNKTLSHIKANTNYQDTGEILLDVHQSLASPGNTRAGHNLWNFNKLKDNNANVFKKKPLVGTYMKVRFKYDNAPNLDSSQNSLYLYDFNASIRKAEL